MNVLIIDEDLTSRLLLRSILTDRRFRGASKGKTEVYLAADIPGVQRYLDRRMSFEYALIDINPHNIHRGDVPAILEKLRKNSPGIVSIIMTMEEDLTLVQECLQAGAADVLFKPFNLEGIHLVLAKAREQQRLFQTRPVLLPIPEGIEDREDYSEITLEELQGQTLQIHQLKNLNEESIHPNFDPHSVQQNFNALVSAFEQRLAKLALSEHGSVRSAAERLGIPRTTLSSKLKTWGWS